MRRSILMIGFMATLAPGYARAEVSICIDHSILTEDFARAFNEQYVPTLPEEMIRSIGRLGGSDPNASFSPISALIVQSSEGVRKIRLKVEELKYSVRFGDNFIFSGVRVGVRGSAMIDSGIGLSADGKNLKLKNPRVTLQLRADMGGTLGHYLGQVLTALMNAFAVQGKLSRQLESQLNRVEIAPTFFQSNIGKDGKKIDVELRIQSLSIESRQFCIRAELK